MSRDSMTAPAAHTVVDPVCVMTIDPANAAGHAEHGGRTYYFCNPSCLQRFQTDLLRFTAPAAAPTETPAANRVEYTCPMHPEVRQFGPGTCCLLYTSDA